MYGDGRRSSLRRTRVNLIGEHTDYNLGFVLPGAIDKAIYVGVKTQRRTEVSDPFGRLRPVDRKWICTAKTGTTVGPLHLRRSAGDGETRGADPSVRHDFRRGTSRSARTFVVGRARSTQWASRSTRLYNLGFSRANTGQNRPDDRTQYVGVRCGIMDRSASLFGDHGKVIRLDCRSLEYKLEPFDPTGCKSCCSIRR